jgi:hypothetical protein
MPTVDYLFFLIDIGAPRWRQRLAARAVLAKVLIRSQDPDTLGLIALRDSL